MKLWIKLSILLTLVITIVIQIGAYYLTPKVEDFSGDLVGEKLKSIAASIAAGIDGDEFKHIDLFDSSSSKSAYFRRLQNTISKAKQNLELSDETYTISLLDRNSIAFGVVLSQVEASNHVLQPVSEEAKAAIKNVYNNKHCEYTSIYSHQNFQWLSGFAPIYDSTKSVWGIVQVDQNYKDVTERIDRVNRSIFFGGLYLLPFAIIVSLITATLFLSPINNVKMKILKIANGDYSESKEIKSSGEIKQLIEASEELRHTILSQQEKIFQNIKELETAKNKAEASDRLKSEFLAVISHEIRTPLNVILGNIEVLKLELDESAINELEEILNPIKTGSERLIRTVEMLVLYSDIVSGGYKLNEEYVNLPDSFFGVIEKYKKFAVQNGLEVNYDCAASTGRIKTDQRLLEEAIEQITDNAVKFSLKGQLQFCIFNKNEEGLELVIKDQGIGMSRDFMKELYKPFQQEDMSYERRYEGNGIGLALAKKCLDLLGYKLIIDSEKNKGTTVRIFIPNDKKFNVT